MEFMNWRTIVCCNFPNPQLSSQWLTLAGLKIWSIADLRQSIDFPWASGALVLPCRSLCEFPSPGLESCPVVRDPWSLVGSHSAHLLGGGPIPQPKRSRATYTDPSCPSTSPEMKRTKISPRPKISPWPKAKSTCSLNPNPKVLNNRMLISSQIQMHLRSPLRPLKPLLVQPDTSWRFEKKQHSWPRARCKHRLHDGEELFSKLDIFNHWKGT